MLVALQFSFPVTDSILFGAPMTEQQFVLIERALLSAIQVAEQETSPREADDQQTLIQLHKVYLAVQQRHEKLKRRLARLKR